MVDFKSTKEKEAHRQEQPRNVGTEPAKGSDHKEEAFAENSAHDAKAKTANDVPSPQSHVKKSKEQELTEMCQRIQADFENYKKRSLKESDDRRQQAKGELIEELLPILDSFELALKSKASSEEFRKGVELIYSQFIDMTKRQGLTPIKTFGQKLDPYRHEVLLTEPAEKEEDDQKIVEELQKGYLLKDKVLRYAKVKALRKQ